MAPTTNKKSRNRKNGPPPKEIATLWGASAGRCNICATQLLVDDVTGVTSKTGEMAHIIGIEDGPRSPRSDERLAAKERDKAANLILLCPNHHTEVDNEPDEWTVEKLRDRKAEFEAHTSALTAMSLDDRTVVVRLVGNIQKQKVAVLSREQARQIVARTGRFPDFSLALKHDIEIDLRELTADEFDSDYFAQSDRRIGQRIDTLRELQADGQLTDHVSVMALGRIPACFQLGRRLGDAGQVTIHHRRNDAGWGWDETARMLDFETIQPDGPADRGAPVTVLVSVSAELQVAELPQEIADQPRILLRPIHAAPGSHALDHPDSQALFTAAWRRLLLDLEVQRPARIDLVTAVPSDAAVALGRVRTPAANPPVRLWDRQGDKYVLAWDES